MPICSNPIMPGRGICDPHIRVYGDTAYLYATHDRSPENQGYVMDDQLIFTSTNLVDWRLACTIHPEQTYYGQACSSCWAVDAIACEDQHFLYFSRGPREIGVIQGDSPIGPWYDPLGRPLIAEGSLPTEARDPGVMLDDDGTAYLVFGTWDFYIARLGDNMITLAEPPRKIEIRDQEGPYGLGKTDDKPYLHKRAGIYYLSWGCFYATAEKITGPYQCKGSFLFDENVDPDFRYVDTGITFDRHGSFFEWKQEWYFICNDMSQTRSKFFRDSVLSKVTYLANGDIAPIRIESKLELP